MRMLFAFLLLLAPWLSATGARPAAPLTVQGAIKLLSREQAKNIVRIEARDGTPAPDRWYLQIYDPAAENGLREIVVWQRAIVSNRTLSQFLDNAKPGDVVGSKLIRIDSDELIRIVQQYVEANNLDVAKINFTMFRDADNPSPVWKLSCLDDSGKKLAELVINARNASVISHDGFEMVPGQTAKPAIPVAPAKSAPPPAVAIPIAAAVTPSPSPLPDAAASPSPGPDPGDSPTPSPTAIPESSTPTPSSSPTPKRSFLQRIFGGGKSTPTPAFAPRNH